MPSTSTTVITRLLGIAFVIVSLIAPPLFRTPIVHGDIVPPKVGDIAPDYEWPALNGGKVSLSKLNAKGPVILIVLRGFPGYQCPICNMQVGELIGKSDKSNAAGARVLLVYPGPAEGLKEHAQEFASGKGIPKNFQFVLDPDYAFLEKYGLRWNAPHETSFPSSFVIDSKGKIVFAKISHTHGGRAKSDEILGALTPTVSTSSATTTLISPSK